VADFLKKTGGIGTTNAEKSLGGASTVQSPSARRIGFFDGDLAVFHAYHGPRKEIHGMADAGPLVDFSHGETRLSPRVWPFFSQATNQYLESDWYLWPIYKFNRVHSDPLDRTRTAILFFLYSDTNREIRRRVRTRSGGFLADCSPGNTITMATTRLQFFAPLEPILPTSKSVERDTRRLWSVWRSEKNAKTGATSSRCCGIFTATRPRRFQKMLAPVWTFPVSIGRGWQTCAIVLYSDCKGKPVVAKSE